MKYKCEFRNTAGEIKIVIVDLDQIEVSSVNRLREQRGAEESGVMAIAYATRAAYGLVPNGFEHFAVSEVALS